MDSFIKSRFILLWDRKAPRNIQQGFFQLKDYPKPEYFEINHPNDLSTITKVIEDNINEVEANTRDEARTMVEESELEFIGDPIDEGDYWAYRYRATAHGFEDEEYMTHLVNGKLSRLFELYLRSYTYEP
jgi:hypothetical protein